MIYPDHMDAECIPLCNAINEMPGLTTFDVKASCCGHGQREMWVSFSIVRGKTLKGLSSIRLILSIIYGELYGTGWKIYLETEPSLGVGIVFTLRSEEMGSLAYKEAGWIAEYIERWK